MKWFKIILMVSFLIMILGCSGNKCQDICDLDRMELFNYKLQSIEEVVIVGYSKGGNFQHARDTFVITKSQKLDSEGYENYVFLNKSINTDYDYDVFFVDLNKHCKITNIKILKDECSNGLFSKDYSISFDEYYVNGEIFKCQVLKALP